MCSTDADARAAFLAELVAAGHLHPTGVPGLYGRGGVFEAVVRGFDALVDAAAVGQSDERRHYPPLFARADYVRTSHIQSFPDLLGSVHAFTGKDREHMELLRKFHEHEDWTRDLAPAAVMMVPAVCYPLYPSLAGTLPEAGRTVDMEGWVFRHEPSDDPARMMCFRQREFVRVGTGASALAHRDAWLERARALLDRVELPVTPVVANDPFFGRGGRLAKATQREQVLKWELVVPITSTEAPTAVASANYHLDYFGQTFGIAQADGSPAHTSCIGFGVERIALALFKTHGASPAAWPAPVRAALEL